MLPVWRRSYVSFMLSAFLRHLLTSRRSQMTWLAALHCCGCRDFARFLGWIEQVLSAPQNHAWFKHCPGLLTTCQRQSTFLARAFTHTWQIRSESELEDMRAGINAKDLYIQQLEEQQSPQSRALSGRSHAGISSERGPLMSTAQCSPRPAVEKFVPALEHELAEVMRLRHACAVYLFSHSIVTKIHKSFRHHTDSAAWSEEVSNRAHV